MSKNCFCHLNGYEVKDAFSRANIICANAYLMGAKVEGVTTSTTLINGIFSGNIEANIGDVFIIENDNVTMLQCVEETQDYIVINPNSFDWIMGSITIENNKTYKVETAESIYDEETESYKKKYVFLSAYASPIVITKNSVLKEINEALGDISSSLDSIIEIQNKLIGGEA